MTIERELCCDDLAAKLSKSETLYAESLLRLAESNPIARSQLVGISATEGPKSLLEYRLIRLLDRNTKSYPIRFSLPVLAISIAMTMAAPLLALSHLPSFSVEGAAAPGDEQRNLPTSQRANESPITKTSGGGFIIRFDDLPIRELAKIYAREVKYSLAFDVEPRGTVTYRSKRPYDFTAFRRMVMVEIERAGYFLAEGPADKSFIVRNLDTFVAEKEEVLKKSSALFGGKLRVISYRSYRGQQKHAPPGPSRLYRLLATTDLSKSETKRLLSSQFSDVLATVRGSDKISIRSDAYAIRHRGKLSYRGSAALKKGDELEVFHNRVALEWNAYDPNPPVTTIRGRFTDSDGKSVRGLTAEYMVFGDFRYDRPIGGKIEIAADGSYSIPVRAGGWIMSPSTLYVMAKAPGFAPVQIKSKKFEKDKDITLDIQLTKGFTGRLQLVSGDEVITTNGIITVKAQDLRHTPIDTIKTRGSGIKIPNCGKLPLILEIKVPGYQPKSFMNVKLAADKLTQLELARLPDQKREEERTDKEVVSFFLGIQR